MGSSSSSSSSSSRSSSSSIYSSSSSNSSRSLVVVVVIVVVVLVIVVVVVLVVVVVVVGGGGVVVVIVVLVVVVVVVIISSQTQHEHTNKQEKSTLPGPAGTHQVPHAPCLSVTCRAARRQEEGDECLLALGGYLGFCLLSTATASHAHTCARRARRAPLVCYFGRV